MVEQSQEYQLAVPLLRSTTLLSAWDCKARIGNLIATDGPARRRLQHMGAKGHEADRGAIFFSFSKKNKVAKLALALPARNRKEVYGRRETQVPEGAASSGRSGNASPN